MPYVNSDGSLSQTMPWSFKRIKDIFLETINATVYFFKTLFGLDAIDFNATPSNQNSRPKRFLGGGGGGGGGGGSNSRPKRPGGGSGSINPNFRTMADLRKSAPSMPSCATGSCPYS